MRVKTFEAASMQEALVTIKQEMGEEAYILSTKTRRPARQGAGAVIEVTAAVDDSGADPANGSAAQKRAPAVQAPHRAPHPKPHKGAAANPLPAVGGTYGLRPPLAAPADPRPAQMPGAPAAPRPAQMPGAPKAPAPRPVAPAAPMSHIEPLDVPAPPVRPAQQIQQVHQAPQAGRSASDDPTVDLQPIQRELLEIRGAMEALREQDGRSGAVLAELDQLKGMLSKLQKHGLPALPHQLPPALLRLYGDLAANDTDPMLAVRLCEYTQRALAEQGGEENMDYDKARLYMRRVVSDFVPVAPPLRPDPQAAQSAQAVALVGPPGAGKTATVAKLAAFARQSLRMGVALLSLDVLRAGGADPLQRHAAAVQAPMHVCITAEDVKNALAYYRDGTLVLIDTPGVQQRDAAGMDRLAGLLEEARPAETHLVLSAASKPRDLAETANRFGRLGPGRLLFTRLDETCTYGPILSTLVRVKRPLPYLGTGPGVPQDLELATSRRVADLILPPTQVQP
jgi:flagellar biosynthesis protein FlhF